MLICGLGSLLLVSCQEQEIRFYNIMALVLIIIIFGLFIYFHHRSSVRLKKAYRELEIANNRAQELSEARNQTVIECLDKVTPVQIATEAVNASGIEQASHLDFNFLNRKASFTFAFLSFFS